MIDIAAHLEQAQDYAASAQRYISDRNIWDAERRQVMGANYTPDDDAAFALNMGRIAALAAHEARIAAGISYTSEEDKAYGALPGGAVTLYNRHNASNIAGLGIEDGYSLMPWPDGEEGYDDGPEYFLLPVGAILSRSKSDSLEIYWGDKHTEIVTVSDKPCLLGNGRTMYVPLIPAL